MMRTRMTICVCCAVAMQLLLWLAAVTPAVAQSRAQMSELQALMERSKLIPEVDQLSFSGRHREALSKAQRLLEVTRITAGADHADTAWALDRLARVQEALGQYAAAEPLLRDAMRIHAARGNSGAAVLSRQQLVVAMEAQGRIADAKAAYADAPRVDPAAVAGRLNYLAVVREEEGRYLEAEALAKRALSLRQETLGFEHADVALTLNNLGMIYLRQGRTREVEPLLAQALAILERKLGSDAAEVGRIAGNLAGVITDRSRDGEVEALLQRAIAIGARSEGADHRNTLISRNNLAAFYREAGRLAEADAIQSAVVATVERALARYRDNALIRSFLGLEPLAARALVTLAAIRKDQGRAADAKAALEAASRLDLGAGPDQPLRELVGGRLGALALANGNADEALLHLRQAADQAARRIAGSRGRTAAPTADERRERLFETAALAGVRAAGTGDPAARQSLLDAAFRDMQWAARSSAGAAVARLSARFALGSDALGLVLRERQDAADDLGMIDRQLAATLAKGAGGQMLIAPLRQRSTEVEARIAALDQRLDRDFPDYAALTAPRPLTLAEARGLLAPDEALLQIAVGERESAAILITTDSVQSAITPLGADAVAREVETLRCGLDGAAWTGEAGRARCSALVRRTPASDGTLPFDLARAYELHQALVAPFAGDIEGRRLLAALPGALASLPLQVLVTAQPPVAIPSTTDGYRDAAWLGRRHAITTLPSVAGLRALRSRASASRADRPLIGFGNPLLDGEASRPADVIAAARARAATACRPLAVAAAGSAADHVAVRGVRPVADVASIRNLAALPETRDEVCAVATSLGAATGDIHLGAAASEGSIRRLSVAGELARYRVLHFATHGAVAGEIGSLEPGLILTPPAAPAAEDDGYLAASEVAQLRLDATLVILSACNTAAGGEVGADALSGLASAFFHAGARNLLVSHWAVYSEAAQQLITATAAAMTRERLRPGEALRRAMLDLADGAGPHPSWWAPFVIVGAD